MLNRIIVVHLLMKEKTKKNILGSRLYPVYRRVRYLRYLRRIRKARKKQMSQEAELDSFGNREQATRQKISERKQARLKRKREKAIQRQERKKHKEALSRQLKEDRRQEKIKKQLEKEERRQARLEARKTLGTQLREEKEQEKQRALQLKLEQKEQRRLMKLRLKEKAKHDAEIEKEIREDKRRQKKQRKEKLKALRPYLYKRRRREFVRSLRSINGETFRRAGRYVVWMLENKNERNLFLKITFNSVSLFVLAYLTLYFLGELATLYASLSFEYDTILFYYKIYYNIDSDQWTPDAVKILYSIKPIAGLVIGTVAIIIFSGLKNTTAVFKLYFLWLFVHGMVMFFGSLLLGTLLNQGFGWVIAYLYYKDTGKMVFSIIAIFSLVVTGTSVARSFLISGNSYFNSIGRENRKFLLISQMLIPALLGTVIISLMKVPNDLYYATSEEVVFEILKLASILILVIPIVISFSSMGTIFFDEEKRRVRFHWIYIMLSVIVYMGYRYLLTDGLVVTG